MQCPFCQTPLSAAAPECPSCRLTFPRTMPMAGALPRLEPEVADTTGLLTPADREKLRRSIARLQRRFPQLVLQIVIHVFPPEHPFSMHVFAMFNAANFAGGLRRGRDNHALLLALDPVRGEAAIIPGYGLEEFLETAALDPLLHLAAPHWQATRWADGLLGILDALDPLLESIAIPETTPAPSDF